MSATCPAGHPSDADDYCSVCGLKIAGAAASGSSAPAGTDGSADPVAAPTPSGPEPAAEPPRPCAVCGYANLASARFCEECGHDLDAVAPEIVAPDVVAPEVVAPEIVAPEVVAPEVVALSHPGRWEAVAVADRAYYDRFEADGIEFPVVAPERRFVLDGDEVAVGRHRAAQGSAPAIDLSAAPVDAGISHQHAVLVRQDDDGWAIIDPGSTNGVYLDDSTEPVTPNQLVALAEGTQVHLGAWTTLTVRRLPD